MNYNETLNYIHSLGNFSLPATLDRIKKALDLLGNPQKSLKAIHIAGTNGKGSVSAMVAKTFGAAGYKTGLFISPFIIDFRERIQINGEFISKRELIAYAKKVMATNVKLTEFEFITALAFTFFKARKIDILVCETGLGGRLDATNTLEQKIAAVITKIGLDHTAILGDTIEKITTEKCGILRECVTITTHTQPAEALSVIKNSAIGKLCVTDESSLWVKDREKNIFEYKGKEYKLGLLGDFQIDNALVAIETIEQSGHNIPYNIIYKALAEVSFPARMEIFSKEPLVVLDGAHNPDGADIIANELKKQNGRAVAVIGMMKDKDYEEVLSKTLKYCKKAVAVKVEDCPRSLTAEELCKCASKYCECRTASNYFSALMEAQEDETAPIFIFGSLYLASSIRPLLKIFFE